MVRNCVWSAWARTGGLVMCGIAISLPSHAQAIDDSLGQYDYVFAGWPAAGEGGSPERLEVTGGDGQVHRIVLLGAALDEESRKKLAAKRVGLMEVKTFGDGEYIVLPAAGLVHIVDDQQHAECFVLTVSLQCFHPSPERDESGRINSTSGLGWNSESVILEHWHELNASRAPWAAVLFNPSRATDVVRYAVLLDSAITDCSRNADAVLKEVRAAQDAAPAVAEEIRCRAMALSVERALLDGKLLRSQLLPEMHDLYDLVQHLGSEEPQELSGLPAQNAVAVLGSAYADWGKLFRERCTKLSAMFQWTPLEQSLSSGKQRTIIAEWAEEAAGIKEFNEGLRHANECAEPKRAWLLATFAVARETELLDQLTKACASVKAGTPVTPELVAALNAAADDIEHAERMMPYPSAEHEGEWCRLLSKRWLEMAEIDRTDLTRGRSSASTLIFLTNPPATAHVVLRPGHAEDDAINCSHCDPHASWIEPDFQALYQLGELYHSASGVEPPELPPIVWPVGMHLTDSGVYGDNQDELSEPVFLPKAIMAWKRMAQDDPKRAKLGELIDRMSQASPDTILEEIAKPVEVSRRESRAERSTKDSNPLKLQSDIIFK